MEAYYWNKLIENSASCWFKFTDQNSVLSPATHVLSNSLFTEKKKYSAQISGYAAR